MSPSLKCDGLFDLEKLYGMIMMNTDKLAIETSELPYAGFLRARYDLPIKSIQRSSNGRITWLFDAKGHDPKGLFNEFIQGGTVPASQFFQELRSLKSMTYM